jgi:hypothetical protein
MLRGLIFFFVLLSMAAQAAPRFPLVENKGQWPSRVVASASVESGRLFLEKNGITYHFFDLSGVRSVHEGKGDKAPMEFVPKVMFFACVF